MKYQYTSSLFEEEELQEKLTQLRLDLLSRFYPFSKEQLLKYYPILNFDYSLLMDNKLIQWDIELIEALKFKMDWEALWKINGISIDYDFVKTYQIFIRFDRFHSCTNINWCDRLLQEFGELIEWENMNYTTSAFSRLAYVRMYQDKVNWTRFSSFSILVKDEEVISEFEENLDWKSLSSNKHLPLSVEFVQKYLDKLDFDILSRNPAALDLIYAYPNSKRWNWEKVILNPAINYSEKNFNFFFINFEKYYVSKSEIKPSRFNTIYRFLRNVFSLHQGDYSYLTNEEFPFYNYQDYKLALKHSCSWYKYPLSLKFIEENKNSIDFTNSQFTSINSEVITSEFLENNFSLFTKETYKCDKKKLRISSNLEIPITQSILAKFRDDIDLFQLASCKKFDWTWDFIAKNMDEINLNRYTK